MHSDQRFPTPVGLLGPERTTCQEKSYAVLA